MFYTNYSFGFAFWYCISVLITSYYESFLVGWCLKDYTDGRWIQAWLAQLRFVLSRATCSHMFIITMHNWDNHLNLDAWLNYVFPLISRVSWSLISCCRLLYPPWTLSHDELHQQCLVSRNQMNPKHLTWVATAHHFGVFIWCKEHLQLLYVFQCVSVQQ